MRQHGSDPCRLTLNDHTGFTLIKQRVKQGRSSPPRPIHHVTAWKLSKAEELMKSLRNRSLRSMAQCVYSWSLQSQQPFGEISTFSCQASSTSLQDEYPQLNGPLIQDGRHSGLSSMVVSRFWLVAVLAPLTTPIRHRGLLDRKSKAQLGFVQRGCGFPESEVLDTKNTNEQGTQKA